MKFLKRLAFTLPEVLITLAIIGIVAVLTIPMLYGKYYELMTITNLKKTYAELQEVIKLSQIDNGDFRNWEYPDYHKSAEFAEVYILPYYRNVKKCSLLKKCFGDYYDYKNMSGEAEVGGYIYASPHYIVNGKPMIISSQNTECVSDVVECSPQIKYVEFFVDVNYPRGNSIIGKDVFVFTLFNFTFKSPFNGYKPDGKHYGLYLGTVAGYYGAYAMPLEKMFEGLGSCRLDRSGHDCGLAIQKAGWKIPEQYPIKF